MAIIAHHHWLFPKDLADAKIAQEEMAKKVLSEDALGQAIQNIAGMDISNTPFDPEEMVFGAVAMLSYPALEMKEAATHIYQQKFPYIPGFLGFREVPVLVEAYQKLSRRPDVIFVDGHGISHPRGLGIASHLGVLLDVPTIGVAKSILVGKPAEELAEEVGSQVSLLWKGKEIGRMLRTKKRCSPLIISTGHKVSLNTAVELVMKCVQGYRLPEPTRHAHRLANICRQNFQASPNF